MNDYRNLSDAGDLETGFFVCWTCSGLLRNVCQQNAPGAFSPASKQRKFLVFFTTAHGGALTITSLFMSNAIETRALRKPPENSCGKRCRMLSGMPASTSAA